VSEIDVYEEFYALVEALNEAELEYAVVGAIALAIHGFPRATTDIDLLIRKEDLERVLAVVALLGYQFPAGLMTSRQTGMELQRVTKVVDDAHVMLDLILTGEVVQRFWKSRQRVPTDRATIQVISKKALIEMKAMAGRPQDLVDIQRLTEHDDA